jgi:hypothetical protein
MFPVQGPNCRPLSHLRNRRPLPPPCSPSLKRAQLHPWFVQIETQNVPNPTGRNCRPARSSSLQFWKCWGSLNATDVWQFLTQWVTRRRSELKVWHLCAEQGWGGGGGYDRRRAAAHQPYAPCIEVFLKDDPGSNHTRRSLLKDEVRHRGMVPPGLIITYSWLLKCLPRLIFYVNFDHLFY